MKKSRNYALSLIVSVVLITGLMPVSAIAANEDVAAESVVTLENDGASPQSTGTDEVFDESEVGAEQADQTDDQGALQQAESAEEPGAFGNSGQDVPESPQSFDEAVLEGDDESDNVGDAQEGYATEESEAELEEQDQYTRYHVGKTISGNGSGTVTIESGSAYPYYDEEVMFTAVPQEGSRLTKLSVTTASGETYRVGYGIWSMWYDDEGNERHTPEYSFSMPDCDVTINATFERIPRYAISKNYFGGGSGTVTIKSGSAYPRNNDEVVFTAVPEKGSRLTKLSVTTASGETYRVNDGIWKDDYYDYWYDDEGNWNYIPSYSFWMPDCDVTINATFEPIPRYAISKNYVGGSNGTVTIIGDGATLYPHAGDLVRFRTSPKTGYTLTRMSYTTASGKTRALSRVEGSGKAGTNSVYEFTMPAENVTLNATFAENHRTIYKEIVGNGQLMLVDNGSGKATMYPKPGDKVRFKAIPGSGYKLTNCNYTLSSTGKTLALSKVAGTTNVYEFTMPNEDVTLGGRFVPNKTVWRSNGRYVVGKDIPAGLYLFTGTVQYYEWDTAHKDPHVDGRFECMQRGESGWEIFRSGYFYANSSDASKRCYAELEDGEVVQIYDGARFTLAETTALLNTKTLKEGTYRVGYDCPAGLYRVIEDTDEYAYATYEIEPSVGSYHSDYYYENWVSGHVLSEEYVRVETGDYLTLNDCTAKWVKD